MADEEQGSPGPSSVPSASLSDADQKRHLEWDSIFAKERERRQANPESDSSAAVFSSAASHSGSATPAGGSGDLRSALLTSRLKSYERSLSILSSEFRDVSKSNAAFGKRSSKLGSSLCSASRMETFRGMQDTLCAVGKALESVGADRCSHLGDGQGQGGALLLRRLQDSKVGVVDPMRALLNDRMQKCATFEKEKKNFEQLKSKAAKAATLAIQAEQKRLKGLPTELAKLESISSAAAAASLKVLPPQTLLDSLDSLESTEASCSANLVAFEERRVVDLKLAIEDMMRREILHAIHVVETLTPLIGAVRGVDGAVAAKELFDKIESIKKGDKKMEQIARAEIDKERENGEAEKAAEEEKEAGEKKKDVKEGEDEDNDE